MAYIKEAKSQVGRPREISQVFWEFLARNSKDRKNPKDRKVTVVIMSRTSRATIEPMGVNLQELVPPSSPQFLSLLGLQTIQVPKEHWDHCVEDTSLIPLSNCSQLLASKLLEASEGQKLFCSWLCQRRRR